MNHNGSDSAAGSFRAFAGTLEFPGDPRVHARCPPTRRAGKTSWTVGSCSSGHSVDDRSSEIASSLVAVAMPRPA